MAHGGKRDGAGRWVSNPTVKRVPPTPLDYMLSVMNDDMMYSPYGHCRCALRACEAWRHVARGKAAGEGRCANGRRRGLIGRNCCSLGRRRSGRRQISRQLDAFFSRRFTAATMARTTMASSQVAGVKRTAKMNGAASQPKAPATSRLSPPCCNVRNTTMYSGNWTWLSPYSISTKGDHYCDHVTKEQ